MTATPFDNLPRPLGVVVHIGAGMASDLPIWLEAGAERIILVEADPDIADRLRAATEAWPQVEVIEAAVSPNRKPRSFHRMNFPDLNALRQPAGLKSLFPGLKVLSQERVRPICPVGLIRSLNISGKGPNLLLVEAPGESLGILRALGKAGLLTSFDMIRAQEGREVLYHRAPTAADVRDFLSGAGFQAWIEQAPADPDRPHVLARLDRTALAQERVRELEAQAAQLQEDLEAARAQIDDLDRAQEREHRARQDAEERAGALEQERDRIRDRLHEAEASRSAAQERVRELEAQAAQLQEESANRLSQLEHAWAKIEAGQNDLKLAQQNLGMALRMQALRESDLEELQNRYAELLEKKAAQDRLLQKLTESLASAAEYLQGIGDLPVPGTAAAPVPGVSSEPRKPAFPRPQHSEASPPDD